MCWTGSKLAHQVDMLSAILEMLVPALLAESRMLCISPQKISGKLQNNSRRTTSKSGYRDPFPGGGMGWVITYVKGQAGHVLWAGQKLTFQCFVISASWLRERRAAEALSTSLVDTLIAA